VLGQAAAAHLQPSLQSADLLELRRRHLDPLPGHGLDRREQVSDGAAALPATPVEEIAERLLEGADLDQVSEAAQRGRIPPAMNEGRGDDADLAVPGCDGPGRHGAEGQLLQRIAPS
jgi:hypothetical protein